MSAGDDYYDEVMGAINSVPDPILDKAEDIDEFIEEEDFDDDDDYYNEISGDQFPHFTNWDGPEDF